jgi:hypothetical protein
MRVASDAQQRRRETGAGTCWHGARGRQARAHLIARGLIGEPVPWVMLSGGAVKKNS